MTLETRILGSNRVLPAPVQKLGRNAFEAAYVLDLDETSAAFLDTLDHPVVSWLGVVDGIKGVAKGVEYAREHPVRDNHRGFMHVVFGAGQMIPAALRVAGAVSTMSPGMIGNAFVAANGLYLAVDGAMHKDKYQMTQGLLTVGVAVSIGCAVNGIGGPIGNIAVLGIGVAKLAHHFSTRNQEQMAKQASAEAARPAEQPVTAAQPFVPPATMALIGH